jgi:murein DD-endopeptidase MepM/ murein hydrolase activator NlpD
MKNRKVILIAGIIAFVGLSYLAGKVGERFLTKPEPTTAKAVIESEPVIKYGMDVSGFTVLSHVVAPNEVFADILIKHNVTYQAINFLMDEAKGVFNVNKIKAGNNCTLLCEKTDKGLVPKKLIYEESKVNYVVFNLDDSLYIYRGSHNVERKRMEVAGVLNGSLYQTLENNDINPVLAVRMSEIFAWSIDFYKLQKGDKFRIIYYEDFVNGESSGVGEISACVFTSGTKDYYAFYFEKDKTHEGDYYDEEGNSMKKMFLKAPVKFSRVSSGFTMKRFHPVTKQWKAHLGTDYAAAYGTPIIATAEGVVEEAQFKAFNGNYVKIKHNGQYKTQYLHMSKIAKGIKRGVHVQQGEVIGYVGSTGLATGPHVCYRFWKDGQQVDPRKEKMMFAEPLPAAYKQTFMAQMKPVKTELEAIPFIEDVKKQQAADAKAKVESELERVKEVF